MLFRGGKKCFKEQDSHLSPSFPVVRTFVLIEGNRYAAFLASQSESTTFIQKYVSLRHAYPVVCRYNLRVRALTFVYYRTKQTYYIKSSALGYHGSLTCSATQSGNCAMCARSIHIIVFLDRKSVV